MNTYTTIKITKDTRDRIKAIGKMGDTYDSVIQCLLKCKNHVKSNEQWMDTIIIDKERAKV